MNDKLKPFFPLFAICLFFIGSIAATIFAWLSVVSIMDTQIKEDYFRDNQNIKSWIQTRLNTYQDLLTATQAFVASSELVTRDEWNRFTQNIQIAERYQGLRAIIYLRRVKHAEKDQFIARIRKENRDLPTYSNFTIRPEIKKAEYFPVTYTYGADLETRLKALGLDVYTEPNRIAALDLSRDNNQLILSAPINLLVNPKPGFIIALPFYEQDTPVDTVKQRREALAGFIYAPFQADDFFNAILKPQGTDAFPNLDLEVFDPQSENPSELFYDKNSDLSLTKDSSRFAYTSEYLLSLGNRHWNIKTGITYKDFTDPKWSIIPLTIFISGLLLSITTFLILLRQYHQITKISLINWK